MGGPPMAQPGNPPVMLVNPPGASGWGTPLFDDIAGLVCELAESHDRAASILAVRERPLLTCRTAGIDVTDSVLPQLETPESVFPDGNTADRLEPEEQIIRHTLRRLRAADALRLPDGVSQLEYVTWDGSLNANRDNAEQIHEEIRLMTGLPSMLTQAAASPVGRVAETAAAGVVRSDGATAPDDHRRDERDSEHDNRMGAPVRGI